MQEAKRNEAPILALIALITLGIGYWFITPAHQISYGGPYLEDPEEEGFEWGEETWAPNSVEAEKHCQRMADGFGAALVKVRRMFGDKWECTFRTRGE